MTTAQNELKAPLFSPALGKRMIAGLCIALALISVFVIGAGKGDPAWGEHWRLKPLLLTPFLGAVVGLCYDITAPLRKRSGWTGRLFLVLSLLGYCAGIWMSLILGLNGTMWD